MDQELILPRQSNFQWQLRDHLRRKNIKIPAAAKSKASELGSGVATTGATVMLPAWRSKLIGLRLESSKITFERSILLVPGDRPLTVRTARVPLSPTPGPDPRSALAVRAIAPAVLSIVPGIKNVAPPPAKNDPSVIETADKTPGARLRSN